MVNSTKKFTGKKLLLLGTSAGTTNIVNYARSQGAYVIVTDNLPPQKSPAKLIADEAWPISTADVDTLEQLAKKNKVNGVFAGVSEFNLERALTLCERMGLPFYCNRQQWETCSNKQRFKKLCRNNGVPVAREYSLNGNNKEEDLRLIEYPVIVKPADNSGGTGISICYNETALLKAYAKAVSLSKTTQAIVEDYIEGDEFLAAYTIKEGQFSLSFVIDRYSYPERSETIPLPQVLILPSKYTDRYIAELNDKVVNMFQSISLTNGFIFLQGIINDDGFHILETNFRIGVVSWYRIISTINRINYMEMMVNDALTGQMEGYDLTLDNPRVNECCCELELVSKGGVIGKIIGLEEIRNKKTLIAIEKRYDTGDYIERSGTLRQIVLRFYLIEDSMQELKNSIREIQDTVKVLDDKGNDMLLPTFNTNRI
jgi:biotin carboxylase